MKNYQYGCRPPSVEHEIEIVRIMRRANRYRNQLVELELRRRKLRTRLGDRAKEPELRKRLNDRHYAAVRDARARCGIYWGTYLAVEQDCEDFSRGDAPRFRRWTGDGYVAVQVQGGLTVERLTSGEDTRLRLLESGHPKGRVLWIRIGSDGRSPRWAVVPVTWHRDLPSDAAVKWCRLIRRVVGEKVRWSVMFTIATAGEGGGDGVVGVDVNCRVFGRRQRVATAVGTDGELRELFLPSQMIAAFAKCEDIRSMRDQGFDDVRSRLVDSLDSLDVPPLIRAIDLANLAQWRSSRRLSAAVKAWSHLGSPPSWLIGWMRREDHLHEYESQSRDQVLAARKDLYRCWAKELAAAYGTVGLERMDLTRAVHRVGTDDDELEMVQTSRRRRARFAALASLRQCLRERCDAVLVNPRDTTTTCHACGTITAIDAESQVTYTCEHCGEEWDQDTNAARNILSRACEAAKTKAPLDGENGLESGLTATGRRKKAVSRAERNATARKRRSEAAAAKRLEQ